METIYDIVGIGIGPFNLGLAALSSEIVELKTLFLDRRAEFSWHDGMMLEGTRLQVPFHADLVTLANPRSRFSFMCYLKARQRLFRFTIREEYFPLRKEYNDYCRWVVGQLSNVRFGEACYAIEYNEQRKLYVVRTESLVGKKASFLTRKLVLGIGTVPWTPEYKKGFGDNIFHSSRYLHNKQCLQDKDVISIIGSGQSAAEIFSDLLEPCFYQGKKLHWFTRSSRFFPMDYSKFALEMTSPDYIDYFYNLDDNVKRRVLQSQASLYKGMNNQLIDSIYDRLYMLSMEEGFNKKVFLQPNTRVTKIQNAASAIRCTFRHKETKRLTRHETQALILATGYTATVPDCVLPIGDRICWNKIGQYDVRRNYSIDYENTIYVQNAELHTHGFNAPDLGMGPYRNAVILNSILGYPHYHIESDVPFQRFG